MKYRVNVGKDWFLNTTVGCLGILLLFFAIRDKDFVMGFVGWFLSVVTITVDNDK